jgi:hypothetical protein
MAQDPLATEGNVLFVSEFRVLPGRGDEMIKMFREFDYSDANLMHRAPAQVKDGVLCRDPLDPDHFYLIGEWKTAEEHKDAQARSRAAVKPAFLSLIEGGKLTSRYLNVVMSTPPEHLNKHHKAS